MNRELTYTEALIVNYLQHHPERVVTKAEIAIEAFGFEHPGKDADLLCNAHLSNIRRKLGPGFIQTVHGVGVRWTGTVHTPPRFKRDGWWGWPSTVFGIDPGLRGRIGEPLQVIAQANNRSRGLAWIRFSDGFEVAAPARSIRRTRPTQRKTA